MNTFSSNEIIDVFRKYGISTKKTKLDTPKISSSFPYKMPTAFTKTNITSSGSSLIKKSDNYF